MKEELIRHGEFKKEDMQKHYDEVAAKYEDIYLTIGFYDHIKCREMAELMFPDLEARESLRICDLGCGTGLVGDELYQKGFRNITGVDLSQGMLNQAAKKQDGQAYSELVQQALGSPETFPESLRGRFDIIFASSVLAQGHLDSSLFDEMILAAAGPGSKMIFTTRTEYLTSYRYQTKMDELEAAGLWKKVSSFAFDRYDKLEETQIGRYQKTEIQCICYEKI